MNSLSTRLSFLIFCIVIAILTFKTVVQSPVIQCDHVSPLSPKDINISINVLQNYSLGKVRTETKDGKLEVIFEVKAALDVGPFSIDSDTGEIETVLNQSIVLRTTPDEKNRTVETEDQTSRKNSTRNNTSEVLNHSIVLQTTQEEKNMTVGTEDQTSKINSTRNNVSKLVKKFPLTISESPYIIKNKEICNSQRAILFLVLVHTATEHFKQRQSFRKTWGNITLYQTYQMRIVFLLGIPKNRSLDAKIEVENSEHGDIVQGNFIDDYVNLTHKGVMGLRWVTENCRQAKFIVKVDDDVFVNTLFLIENLLGKFWNSSRQIMGKVEHSAEIFRRGKWDVGKDKFVNMTKYPFPYSPGMFVILTNDIIEELYKAAKDTEFFWIDDVYLFGILPDKVGNITLSPIAGLNNREKTAIDCFQATKKNCDLLAANANDGKVMEKMWGLALWQNTKLATKYLTYKR